MAKNQGVEGVTSEPGCQYSFEGEESVKPRVSSLPLAANLLYSHSSEEEGTGSFLQVSCLA